MKPGTRKKFCSILVGQLLILFSVFFSCSGDGEKDYSWTIMFFANGDNNLEDYILSDLKEMELATLPDNITIIALVDRPYAPSEKFGKWSDTKLFRVVHGSDENTLSSAEIESSELSLTVEGTEELNMCDSSVFSSFIDFCKSNYPSDKYALIIGSHGDGWEFPSLPVLKSIGYDETSSSMSTSIADLAAAIKIHPPDLLVFDACNMGNIETLYELKDCAKYIAASPNPLPVSGFDYEDLFSNINCSGISEYFALQFSSSWQRVHDDTTMMVYDMDSFAEFIDSNSNKTYVENLAANVVANPTRALEIRNKSIRYSVDGISDHIDIVDFYNRILPENGIEFDSFIITENQPKLSFYFPLSIADYKTDYINTCFAKETSWDEALNSILQ